MILAAYSISYVLRAGNRDADVLWARAESNQHSLSDSPPDCESDGDITPSDKECPVCRGLCPVTLQVTTLKVLLDEAGTEVNVELYQW